MNWRRSSFSAIGECVEVQEHENVVLVRNSNDLGAGTLSFTREEMAAFIRGCKAGEFDDLA